MELVCVYNMCVCVCVRERERAHEYMIHVDTVNNKRLQNSYYFPVRNPILGFLNRIF